MEEVLFRIFMLLKARSRCFQCLRITLINGLRIMKQSTSIYDPAHAPQLRDNSYRPVTHRVFYTEEHKLCTRVLIASVIRHRATK